MVSELAELLAAEAVDAAAPAGVVELESSRDRKPLGVGIYVKYLVTGEEAGGDYPQEEDRIGRVVVDHFERVS